MIVTKVIHGMMEFQWLHLYRVSRKGHLQAEQQEIVLRKT